MASKRFSTIRYKALGWVNLPIERERPRVGERESESTKGLIRKTLLKTVNSRAIYFIEKQRELEIFRKVLNLYVYRASWRYQYIYIDI